MVADAVDVPARHAEELGELQDHAALGRAAARQLQQVVAGEDQLIAPAPALAADEGIYLVQHGLFLFKQQLDDRQVHLAEAFHLHRARARQMLVVAREFVRVQHVDAPVVVIDLEAQRRKAREQRVHMLVDVRIQERGLHISAFGKVVDRRAVCDHARRVDRQRGGKLRERRQRPPGRDGKVAAVCDEVIHRRAVARAHRRDILAALQRALGVNERVVKVAGKQHVFEFLHGRSPLFFSRFHPPVYHGGE